MEIWDTVVESKPGVVEYQRWRAEVLALRDMAEYRLRRLWRLGFTPADIAADKHWEVYPPASPPKPQPGMPGNAWGRGMTVRGVKVRYAKALLKEARSILQYNKLDTMARKQVQADVEQFKALVENLKKGEA